MECNANVQDLPASDSLLSFPNSVIYISLLSKHVLPTAADCARGVQSTYHIVHRQSVACQPLLGA